MDKLICVILFPILTFFSLGKGSHHHQNRYDEHKRCHPHYRQSFDARNRRAGRTSRSVNGDVHFSFSFLFSCSSHLNSNFSPVSIPPSFPRFFHSPSSYTISLGSTNSIPFFLYTWFSGGKHLYPPEGRLNCSLLPYLITFPKIVCVPAYIILLKYLVVLLFWFVELGMTHYTRANYVFLSNKI